MEADEFERLLLFSQIHRMRDGRNVDHGLATQFWHGRAADVDQLDIREAGLRVRPNLGKYVVIDRVVGNNVPMHEAFVKRFDLHMVRCPDFMK
ncbi:hypothetical protein D3C72_2093720 [compost metagenome]